MSNNTRPKPMKTMESSTQSPLRRVARDGWNGCGYTHTELLDYFGEEGEEMWQRAAVTWQYRAPAPLSRPRDQSGPPSSSSFDSPYGQHYRSLDLGLDQRRRQKDAPASSLRMCVVTSTHSSRPAPFRFLMRTTTHPSSSPSAASCEKTPLSFLSCPCVCPEPVLVKWLLMA